MGRSTTEAAVHITLNNGAEVQAGTLYASGDECVFRYSAEYVASPQSFDLFPSLPRSLAPFHFAGLGPFSDCAPDRWGRKVFARSLNRTRVSESEYLFGVNDLTRQGAIRFVIGGEPVAGDEGVPVLAGLPDLLNTADAVEQNRDVDNIELRRLYRATGSLGGARPKASVIDRNTLWLAKFPKPNGDDWDVIGWEAVTLEIARMAGITVPDHRILTIHDRANMPRTVLLTQRFDRDPAASSAASSALSSAASSAASIGTMRRIPYMSAMTALEAQDGDSGDWLDLAEFARQYGCDTTELWRRAVFGAAIGNLDDHLRNHGFLHIGTGWKLAPAFDMNPEPYDEHIPDRHQMSLFGRDIVEIGQLLSQDGLELFGVRRDYAIQWMRTLESALAQALARARLRHIDAQSVALMRGRFEWAVAEIRRVIQK